MGQWDNRTMELQDKLWDHGTMGHTMGQWDYRTNYGTAYIMGSEAVPLPTGQTTGSWDNRTMG